MMHVALALAVYHAHCRSRNCQSYQFAADGAKSESPLARLSLADGDIYCIPGLSALYSLKVAATSLNCSMILIFCGHFGSHSPHSMHSSAFLPRSGFSELLSPL